MQEIPPTVGSAEEICEVYSVGKAEVWSLECGMQIVKCHVLSVNYGVQALECKV